MRAALLVTLCVIFAIFAGLASAKLSFTLLGDWGRKIDYANTIAASSELEGSRFVLALGDNFYDQGVANVNDPLWKSIFENVYTHAFFQKKWYVIAGNHDYRGNETAQIAYAKQSTRWVFPSRYYKFRKSFDSGAVTVDFFMLDTTPLFDSDSFLKSEYNIQAFDSAQIQWLDTVLGQSTATWKIVVGHHQMYSTSVVHTGSARFVQYLKPVLEKHNVPAYINGHIHHAEHLASSKLHYITTGNVATQDYATTKVLTGITNKFLFPMESEFSTRCVSNGCFGFATVSIIDALKMQVSYFDKKGKKLATIAVPNR